MARPTLSLTLPTFGSSVPANEWHRLLDLARAAGSAMRNNPIPFVIPCHRVVAAGNKIGGYGGGRNAIALKRELLAREGVTTLR